MYFVDREQIEQRLRYIGSFLIAAVRELEEEQSRMGPLSPRLAWERILHLSIESITDIGSLMIDGFIMRDASSYEDIVEVLNGEGVFDEETGRVLYELVKLRRPLVQQYYEIDESLLEQWKPRIAGILQQFGSSVEQYLQRELG